MVYDLVAVFAIAITVVVVVPNVAGFVEVSARGASAIDGINIRT